MDFKKRVNGSWTDTPNYIHNTFTDTITIFPADIYPTGTTATVGLKGQMEQNGTPTPTAPIQPQECGDLETVGVKAGQYKIPISSAGQTTTVYLGEVETTRKIRKLVLTGKETFYRDKEREGSWRFYSDRLVSANYNLSICSHFVNIGASGVNNTDNIGFSLFNASQFGCRCPKSVASTVNEFKAWLANQYAAGTPITVWYVLATPETGIVNEPLRKIGDYADTVSGITIPTIAGANTIDVDTTLKPSEVSVNYKGWHPVSALHRFNGTSWD